MVVFGIGMTIFVAPLTAAVLGALPDEQAGIASAVNNAAARLAQLMAGAALPAAAGLTAATAVAPGAFSDGFRTAMLIAAGDRRPRWPDRVGDDPRAISPAAPRHPSPSQACTACAPEREPARPEPAGAEAGA